MGAAQLQLPNSIGIEKEGLWRKCYVMINQKLVIEAFLDAARRELS